MGLRRGMGRGYTHPCGQRRDCTHSCEGLSTGLSTGEQVFGEQVFGVQVFVEQMFAFRTPYRQPRNFFEIP